MHVSITHQISFRGAQNIVHENNELCSFENGTAHFRYKIWLMISEKSITKCTFLHCGTCMNTKNICTKISNFFSPFFTLNYRHFNLVVIVMWCRFLACNFTKSNIPPWCFSRFVNCTNGTKSRNTSHTNMYKYTRRRRYFKTFLKKNYFRQSLLTY